MTGEQEYLIDLSFELATPLHVLRQMSLSDLQLYQSYTQRRGFPGRRAEMLLAQISLSLFQVNGAKEVSLPDFLFDPPDDLDDQQLLDPDAAALSAADAFGFKPRNLKKHTH